MLKCVKRIRMKLYNNVINRHIKNNHKVKHLAFSLAIGQN